MNRALPLHGMLPDPAERPRFAVAGKGFRPFFFGAAVFAALIVPLWLGVLGGAIESGTYLDPVAWHAHEMVFGYAVAVIAGFLLTAVANWTQRETLTGMPLLALVALWALGRVAMLVKLPFGVAAVVDLSFLPALAVAIGRPLVATRNRRNLIMLGVLAVLGAANVAVHLEALGFGHSAHHALRVGLDVIVFLMLVIAGRVIPMFTRNATNVASIASIPALERLTIASALALVVVDIALPESRYSNAMAGVCAMFAAARAFRWGTIHTRSHPLLWILHLGYAWIPVGLAMRALALPNAAHALTVGAIGALTVGMMARVTLGHTGRRLESSSMTVLSFGAIGLAAAARVFLPLVTADYHRALIIAGLFWTLAFVFYLGAFARPLFRPRPDGKAG